MATGLATILALQVFVIVGGVTRVIPLTGVTLPFVSYGGSSILANFVLVALLLLVSDRARLRWRAMNGSIQKLFGSSWSLFALLVAWTSRWTVFDATALQNNPLNKLANFRSVEDQARADPRRRRHVLARSVKAGGGTWGRTYPTGSLFAQPVGYFNAVEGQRAGWSAPRTPSCAAADRDQSVFGPLGGGQQVGNDVYTTLDPKAQALARRLLAGRAGSVVAIVPQTGAIQVMYSNPTLRRQQPDCPGASCSTSAATRAIPPGSTFKIVTTTAALDSGRYTPESVDQRQLADHRLRRAAQNNGNQSWGP